MPTIRSADFWGKFGKKPAKRDQRNFKFGALLAAAPALPKSYDFDTRYLAVPTPMYGNDVHGDCVIAGRAHQTLRFEYLEQQKVLIIPDKDVLREWHGENGNTDDGLSVLDSLNEWRAKGWKAAGRTYKIKAFAEIDRSKPDELRRAIVMQVGVGLGLTLPYNAVSLFQAGRPWDVSSGPGGKPDPEGGHYVYCPGYTELGPVCVTWGRKQQMTWRFFKRFCDEAYALIDARDSKFKTATGVGGRIDHDRLDELLAEVDKGKGGTATA
jgi:hypothetical protein